MSEFHHLSTDAFDALAAGHGDASVLATLRSAQLSKRMVQLDELRRETDSAEFRAHFELLVAAVRADPSVGSTILAEPHTGAWLAMALRRCRRGDGMSAATTTSYLASLALAAAVRAGVPFRTERGCRDGLVIVPTLGAARVGEADRVTISSIPGGLCVDGTDLLDLDRDGPHWTAQRRLRSVADGLTIEINLDDINPLRDHHGIEPSDA